MRESASRYSFRDIEEKWYCFWEKNGCFHAEISPDKKPFVIVIPPPNVTGILHMGHALNNTIQDILTRYKKMCGFQALWMPGTDHAGIATQNVVERRLARENISRQELGREKFLERVRQWKEEYGSTIIRQLKRLGCACDWQRTRFTMDAQYSEAVTEVFIRLYEKGLIYRGNYIINWCPRCQTALSDEEAPYHGVSGFLYHIKYPLEGANAHVVVATTRPETMLGDTAVAVHPADKRYKPLIGKSVILPLMERRLKVIADEFVDPEFGSGAVKVTPAHDPNDYAMAGRHQLEFIKIMHPDGRLNENAGDYGGLDRFEAREAIIEDLKERGLLLKVEPHAHAVGHCYRCHTIIEPYLSRQWFVRMKPLSRPAISAAVTGKIKFYPARWKKVYLNWMENIRDWCISRQIWWGHRLPVYYCGACREKEDSPQSSGTLSPGYSRPESAETPRREKGIIVSRVPPRECPDCGSTDLSRDEDVLDTWFSSWLWPFAVFGWPFCGPEEAGAGKTRAAETQKKELAYFYPTAALVTAQEIIFFWVARMIMAGLEFAGDVPFRDVYIHGTVRDSSGKKMSKSLGNIIDPLEVIEECGADALRFSLISLTAMGQDVYLSRDKFEAGRNFANKIWNASRFILLNLDRGAVAADFSGAVKKENFGPAEAWIISRFFSTLKKTGRALHNYRFNEAAGLLYEFFWHQFCDRYIELAKLNIAGPAAQTVLFHVLELSLRALHPFMPFITEEIWQRLETGGKTIMEQSWPRAIDAAVDTAMEERMEGLFGLISAVRNLRSTQNIKPQEKPGLHIYVENKTLEEFLREQSVYIERLANVSRVNFLPANVPPSVPYAGGAAKTTLVYLETPQTVDKDGERRKIEAQMSGLEAQVRRKENLLANEQFARKAPPQVIEKEKNRLEELREELKKLSVIKDALSI